MVASPQPWSIVAAVFIALFILTLIGIGLVLRHSIFRGSRAQDGDVELQSRGLGSNNNPHNFGTEGWRAFEESRASKTEHDALMIANLEFQVDLLQDAYADLEEVNGALEKKTKQLVLDLLDERRKYEPIDPEVLRQFYKDIHAPTERSASSPPSASRSPVFPFLNTTKLRDNVKRNSSQVPRHEVCIVEEPRPVRSRTASVVELADAEE